MSRFTVLWWRSDIILSGRTLPGPVNRFSEFSTLREAPGQMRERGFGVVPQPYGLAGSVEVFAFKVDAADPVVVLRNPALVPLHEFRPAEKLLGVSWEFVEGDSAEFPDHIATVCVRAAGGHPGTSTSRRTLARLPLLQIMTSLCWSGTVRTACRWSDFVSPSSRSFSPSVSTMSSRAAAACLPLSRRASCAAERLWRGASCLPVRGLNVQATSEQAGKLKSIDDLPGPSWPRTLYWLFARGYADKAHLLQCLQKSLYGPIWRSRFGPFDIVNVASPDLISQVIQQEGRYPLRVELAHWKEYRDLRGQAYGLHVDTGPEWSRMRSVLNPKMLKLQEVSAYAAIIHLVVGDLLRRVELIRSRSHDGSTVSDLAAELYKFGFEGISYILFETRLGCLEEQIPHDTQRFIGAVNDMLTLSDIVILFPRWTRSILPFWGRFVQAWDDLYDVAKKLVDRRVAEIEAQAGSREPAEGLYLTYLLASDKMSRAEVYISVMELMLGGVDTTSNTLSWALYQLARNRRSQDLLFSEVNSVCPNKQEPTRDDLNRMPFLKAVIKETLRLYPVVHGNGRFVSENEVILDNYWFPKKTQFHLCHYATCHDEGEFKHPEEFIPERWLQVEAPSSRSDRAMPGFYQHHPYSFIPFGVGVRACVGRRVAEMEMFFALSRLVQNYTIEPEAGAPVVEPKTRTLLVPSKPINLRFLPRT